MSEKKSLLDWQITEKETQLKMIQLRQQIEDILKDKNIQSIRKKLRVASALHRKAKCRIYDLKYRSTEKGKQVSKTHNENRYAKNRITKGIVAICQ